MEIEIPFSPEMAKAVFEGRKICTSRNKRYGKEAEQFEVEGKTFFLVAVMCLPLAHVARFLYVAEGFNYPDEFIATWNKLHPRKVFEPEHLVWVHFFEAV